MKTTSQEKHAPGPLGLSVLLVEDSLEDAELVHQALQRAGDALVVRRVDSAAAMTQALGEAHWDVVLSDCLLPGFSSTDALQLLRAYSVDIPFIVVSGRIGEEEAVALMKSGANDYVMKEGLARLLPAVRRALVDAQGRLAARCDQLALRESEARYKAIVSKMPGMVFEMEFAVDGQLSFVSVSSGCQDLFNVAPGAVLSNPDVFIDSVFPDDLASFQESLRLAFRQATDWNWEGRIRVAGSSSVKWVSLRAKSHRREDRRRQGSLAAVARVNRRAKSRRAEGFRICWFGIAFDITQEKFAELEIRRAHEDLERLSAHVEVVKERERSHIAREIHDELGGTLTAIKIMLMRVGQELAGASTDETRAQQRLHAAEALLESTMEITRRIATSLRPGILDLGIVAAIEWQAAEFEKRMDMCCRVTCAAKEIPLDNQISIVLFRTFQEALTNIAKHSGATRVEVELEADDDNVILQVHDNGRGIASADLNKSQAYGILGVRERARILGGEASVRRTRGGTAVMLSIPRTVRTPVSALGTS